jgi:hypothetical protein
MTYPFSLLFYDAPAPLEDPSKILSQQDRTRHLEWLGTFNALFTPSPERWGFRGDPHLWKELTAALSPRQLPESVDELLKNIRETFLEITGHKLLNEGSFFVERFATGGMSSGLVSMDYWRGVLWQELVSRFLTIKALRNEPVAITTEKDLDLMLEHSIWTDNAFRHWFLTKCGLEADNWKCVWSRADSPWTTVINEDGKSSQGETDVLIVFANPDGDRMALHIENKRPGGKFVAGQAAQYPLRAAKLSSKAKYGSYSQWRTVLVAPKRLVDEHPTDVAHFDASVPYEEVASRIAASPVSAR